MTDKLPEFVEQWLAAKQFPTLRMTEVGSFEGHAIDVADLRDFLAKFVLCQREQAAWQVQAILDDKLHKDTFDTLATAKRYAMTDGGIVVTLHAPATEEPK